MKTKRIGFLKGILSAVFMLALIVTMVAVMPMTVSATNVSEVVYASNLVDGDDIVLIGDTTLYVNADVSLKSIKGDYALEIQSDGEHTLTIDNPNGCAINVKTLSSVKPSQGTVNLTIKGGDDYFAIYTTGDISLAGIKLDVNGSAGIRSEEGNVTINGTNVSVVGNDGVGVIANGGSISIDSDYLFVQCVGQSGDAKWEHGIGALKDVTIISDDATIAGSYGIESATGNISLTGTFWIGGTANAVVAHEGTITMTGAVTAQGGDTEKDYFVIYAKEDINFTGSKLDVKGDSGIRAYTGNITINGNLFVSVKTDVGVNAPSGSVSIDGDTVSILCAGEEVSGWADAIGAKNDVTLKSNDATIASCFGIYSEEGDISLTGNIAIGAVRLAIKAESGSITMNGSITAQGSDTEKDYFVIYAKEDINFTGSKLDVKGDCGIRSSAGDIKLNGNISVVVNNNIGIHATEGSINIEGSSVSVECKGAVRYGLLTAVNANDGVTIKSTKATITGEYGIYSEEGSISLYGDVSIDANYYGVCAKTGNIYIKKNAVINGSNGAVSAENGVIFLDTFCNIEVPVNGSNIGSTIVDGNGVKATSVTIKYVPIATSDITITNNTQTKTSITAYKDLPIEFDFDVTFSDTLEANNPKYKVSITYRNINSVTTTVAHTWTSGTHFNKSITLGAAGVYKVAQIVEIDIDGDGQYDYSTNKVFTVNVASELPTYTITTNKVGMGGYINADVSYKVNGVATAQAKPGQTVTIYAVPNANTSITYIKVMQGSNEITVTDNSFVMPFGNVTVEVGLSHGTHYVTYRPGKGVTGSEQVKYAFNSDNQITLLPTGYFSKAGYRQTGWTDTINTYSLGETITLAKNTVIYPVFEVVPFTITYKYGNNTFGGTTEYKGVNVSLAGATSLASHGFNKPGYRIIGWAKTENATTPDYACGSIYEEKVTVTLYPVFSQLTVIDVLDVIPKEKETVDVGDANMPFEAATDGLFTVVTKQNGTVIDQYYTIAQHSTTVLTVEFTAGAEYSFANDLSVYFDMYTPENIISVVWEKVSSDATTATFTVTIKSMCTTGHSFTITKYAHPCVGETEDTVVCDTCGFETTQERDASLDDHHKDNLIFIDEVDADCVDKDGVASHYECEACGSWFKKPFGQPYTKIDPDSCVIEAGHYESGSYYGDGYHHWSTCIRCATQEPPVIYIIPSSYAPCVDEDGNQLCDVCVSLIPCEHDWGEWTVYEYCDSEGQMTRECSICHDIESSVIQATGHTDSAWLSDGTNHYKECTVCHEITVEKTAHSGGTATCTERKECTVCHHKYGEFNTSNHTGTAEWTQTDTHHSKAYTCCGAVTVASEVHEFANGVCTECGYGCNHKGGTATCTEKAECEICHQKYGEFDKNNHSGTAKWTTTATTHEQKYDCCNAVVVASASHIWNNNGKCIECEYACQHSATLVKGTEATCTVNGVKDCYVCAHCGLYFADENCTTKIDYWSWEYGEGKIAASHNYGTLIPATPEKHTQTELVAGIAAHYQCSVCDKYFTSAKVETTLQELTGATPSHSYGAWQTNDDKHWKECSCGLKSEENNHVYDNATDVTCNTCDYDRTLPHTHGNGVKQLGQSATCTVNGWKDYYKCSCGKLYAEATCTNEITSFEEWKNGAGKIEASHNYGTLVSAVTEKHTQTELVASVAAHYHCSACGKYFTEGKVETTLEALTGTTPSHSYGDWKTDADKHWKECSCGKKADEGNHVDANSNNKCDSCDKTLSSGGVTPPPHTHDYGTTWKFDGTNHWKECSCGDKKEVTAHSGGTATCEAKAKCSECNTEYGELAEHKYSEATCTAKAKCSVCGDEKGELAAHTYVDGKCACGATDPNYQPPHEHNFVEGKCECGETDPNYQPPHEHNFVEGKCECGETDPNYTPGTDTPGTDVPGTDVPGTDKPEDPDDGLSGGAIAGIVAGSVVVLGGGGFALWWFVFRKKKLI